MTEGNSVKIMFIGQGMEVWEVMLFLQVMYINHEDMIYWAHPNFSYVHTLCTESTIAYAQIKLSLQMIFLTISQNMIWI